MEEILSQITPYLKEIIIGAATLIATAIASFIIAKVVAMINKKKIISYIKETVAEAEELYPNLGKKMGLVKLKYVTDNVLAKFPKLKDNQYLRNTIEEMVLEYAEERTEQEEQFVEQPVVKEEPVKEIPEKEEVKTDDVVIEAVEETQTKITRKSNISSF